MNLSEESIFVSQTANNDSMANTAIYFQPTTDKSIEEKESEVLSLIILNNDIKMSIPIEHFENIEKNKFDESSFIHQFTNNQLPVHEEELTEGSNNINTIVVNSLTENCHDINARNFPILNESQHIAQNIADDIVDNNNAIPGNIANDIVDNITENITKNINSSTAENIAGVTGEVISNQIGDDIDSNIAGDIAADTIVGSTTDENIENEEVERAANILSTFDHNIERVGNTVSLRVHSCDVAWISLLKKFEYVDRESRIRGYVDGEKELLKLWETFQTSTLSCFTIRSSEKFYKSAKQPEDSARAVDGKILTGKAQWKRKPLVPFDGVPFVLVNKKYSGCRLGGNERTRLNNNNNTSSSRKSQSLKVGCPAEAEVLEVWRVPELSLEAHKLKSCRHKIQLKKELLSKVHPYILKRKFKKRFYVTLPLISKHQNHALLNEEAGQSRYLHPKVIETIYDCVNQGISDRKIIRAMLEELTRDFENDFDIKVKKYDRSFYPTDRDLTNHIRNATSLLKEKNKTEKLEAEKLILNIDGQSYEIDVATALNVQNDANTNYTAFNDFDDIIIQHASFREVDLTNDEFINDGVITPAIGNHSLPLQNDVTFPETGIVNFNQLQTCNNSEPKSSNTGYNQSQTLMSFSQSELNIGADPNVMDCTENCEQTGSEIDQMSFSKSAHQPQPHALYDESGSQSNQLMNFFANSTDNIDPVQFDVFNACVKSNQSNSFNTINNQSNSFNTMSNQLDCNFTANRKDMKTLLKQEIQKSLFVINDCINNVTDERTLRGVLKKMKSIQKELNGGNEIKKGKSTGIHSLVQSIESHK